MAMELQAATTTLAAAGNPLPVDAASVRSAPSMRVSIRMAPMEDPDRVPHLASHRHAAPSAPWPWIDLEDGT